MSRFRFGERDEEIVRSLAVCVRLFSLRQIAKHWFFGEVSNARRRLRQLQAENFIQRVPIRARPLPRLENPGVAWNPGNPTPDFGAASVRFRQRWQDRPLRDCTAFIATSRTARMFGGRGRGELQHGLQVTHDLGVSQVWMFFDEHRPDWADAWRGEDLMAHTRKGQKLPDAFIVDDHQRTICVIEFGGAYDSQRIREFHRDCERRNIGYQIW